MAWQDAARKSRQDKVMEILSKHSHENVLVLMTVQVDEDSTLRMIRAFTQSEIDAGNIKIGPHSEDFVQGLIGVLLGHQYLVEINILHHDVSENNVVLTCIPDQLRGTIINFDMAIRYEVAKQHLQGRAPIQAVMLWITLKEAVQNGLFKAKRTGTTPYMTIDVLDGKGHTHYDDIESFFYILLLFFFSYNGLLPQDELKDAHDR
ncbi:hypothetical protein F5I97DRAFT_2006121 [Phlebopus sp. FC_14]|nr:hypothetical protein F5I97DRAFT_2006121 [Phlebopus sp. FC_14]